MVKALQEQALRAYNNLLTLFDKVNLDIKTKLSLFDSMVVPIILYGSEIWGVYNCKDVDKLHIRFCKSILGVKQQTPNYAVFGELGRVPLSVKAVERSIKFWLKIMYNPGSALYHAYIDQCENVSAPCWATQIHSIIDSLGFSNIRLQFDVNVKYMSIFKNRIYDQFFTELEGINSVLL